MPDTRLPNDIAQFVGVFVESIFYGIYLVTFFASLHTTLWSGHQRTWTQRLNKNRAMFLAVILMFTFSTLNLALGFVRIVRVYEQNKQGGGGAVEQLGNWVNIVKPLCVNLQIMVADIVVTYRCWVVYAKSPRVVALPIFLFLGVLVCTIVSMHMQTTPTSGSRINGGNLFPIIISFWGATILLNIYTTTMIVLRIWRVVDECATGQRAFPLYPTRAPSRLQLVLRIIIESALTYTVTTVIVFVTLVTGSNSIYITTAAEIQVIGITFNLILIRAKNASETMTTMGFTNGHTGHAISFAGPTNEEATSKIDVGDVGGVKNLDKDIDMRTCRTV